MKDIDFKDIDFIEEVEKLNLKIKENNGFYIIDFDNNISYTIKIDDISSNLTKSYALRYIEEFLDYDNSEFYIRFLNFNNLNRGFLELLLNFKKLNQNKLKEMMNFFDKMEMCRESFEHFDDDNQYLCQQTVVYEFIYNDNCFIDFPINVYNEQCFEECYNFYEELKLIVEKKQFTKKLYEERYI